MGTSLLWKTDVQLREAVQRELDWDPEVSAGNIAVMASDGAITLTGFVHSYAEKLAAERLVKRVAGVRAVANDIEVMLPSERADSEIAKDAVHALEGHVGPPNRVTATVRHGFITLEGTVEWMYQKEAALSAVKHLKGVKGASNAITISSRAFPAQVKTQIEEALRRSAEVDAAQIYVAADDHTVTLSGRARSWAERQEAERAAWAAPGVTSVNNHIAVTP